MTARLSQPPSSATPVSPRPASFGNRASGRAYPAWISTVNRPPPAVAWSLAQVAGLFGTQGLGSSAEASVGHGLVVMIAAAAVDHVSLPASKDEKPLPLASR